MKEKIKYLKESGFTYKAIAAQSGVNYKTIRNLMCGTTKELSAENTQKMREFLEQFNKISFAKF